MESMFQADLQAVADKHQVSFSVTVTLPPAEPTSETVVFTPAAPSV